MMRQSLWYLFALLPLFQVSSHPLDDPSLLTRQSYATTCAAIAAAVSSASAVYYPGTPGYIASVYHFSSSSSQASACAVEPGTAADVSIIIQIIGQASTPFAVKGGGHTANQGFSSTPGVQISMARFSEVNYDPATTTVDVGAGLVWDDVYEVLPPLGVNVVGGRVSGVGIAGLTLGGGYSYKTNQFGLVSDNVVAYEVVLPSGSIVSATATSYSDLFWALRGAGQVNFGIVTKFTFQTHAQSSQVYGGYLIYAATEMDAVAQATYEYSIQNDDPLASILPTFTYAAVPLVEVLLFYDAPTPPAGTFDAFFDIPYIFADISTRSYVSLIQAPPDNLTANSRGAFNTVPLLHFSPTLMEQVVNQTLFWGAQTLLFSSAFISIDVEPFLSSAFQNSDGGAYPHSAGDVLLPLCFFFTWELEADDAFWLAAIKESADVIFQQALAEGQPLTGPDVVLYNNYALADTPLQALYGSNVGQLQSIHAEYDPTNVMGLAGGFKV